MDTYRLDGKVAVLEPDFKVYGEFFTDSKRRVGDTTIDGVRVSTVFLVIDHAHGDGPPMLFETMVFGGPLDCEMRRYSTWEQAETGHADMVERVRKGFTGDGEQR